jgi:KRAB domain-containing zinc finger protein
LYVSAELGSGEYGCRRCEFRFHSVDEYQVHYAAKHTQSVLERGLRLQSKKSTSQLSRKLRQRGLPIKKATTSNQPLPVVLYQKGQECDICGRFIKASMNVHLWTHLGEEEKAAWLASGKKDPTKRNRTLLENSKKNLPFQCVKCGKRFAMLHYLKAHEESHVPKEDREKLICDVCGQSFTTKRGLDLHGIRVHHPDKLIGKWKECKICDKKYLIQTHLDVHMMRHHGKEKKIVCELCGLKFVNMCSLRKHSYAHLPPDQRPFKCTHCPMDFRHSGNLFRHVEKDHPEEVTPTEPKSKPIEYTCKQMYPCPVCDKLFPLPSRLTKHLASTGHGDKINLKQ